MRGLEEYFRSACCCTNFSDGSGGSQHPLTIADLVTAGISTEQRFRRVGGDT